MSLDPAGFAFVRDLVRRDSAIVLDDDKSYLVESRLLPLARQCGSGDVNTFVRQLRTHLSPQARRDVVEALTTNETSFFRDHEPFRVLGERVLPDLLNRRPGRRVTVWSAAASSGQEAYSLCMTQQDTPALADLQLQVHGTDLSRAMVRRAQEGLYTQLEVNRGVPAAVLVKHFTREGTGWRISPTLRAMCSFAQLNLIAPFSLGRRFDIVLLRNVLIYFEPAVKQAILRRVADVLAPDGYLILGSTEQAVGLDREWERQIDGRLTMYRPRKDPLR